MFNDMPLVSFLTFQPEALLLYPETLVAGLVS